MFNTIIDIFVTVFVTVLVGMTIKLIEIICLSKIEKDIYYKISTITIRLLITATACTVINTDFKSLALAIIVGSWIDQPIILTWNFIDFIIKNHRRARHEKYLDKIVDMYINGKSNEIIKIIYNVARDNNTRYISNYLSEIKEEVMELLRKDVDDITRRDADRLSDRILAGFVKELIDAYDAFIAK